MSEGRVYNPAHKEPWIGLYELLGEYEELMEEQLLSIEPEGNWREAYADRLERVVRYKRLVAERGNL